jgi:hypothetical protein
MALAELPNQDAYSYELGAIFIGANSRAALMRDFKSVFNALDLRFQAANTVQV